MFAAQTGTGKTFSYLLPIIHLLKQQELTAEAVLTAPNRPRSLILLPNRELAMQVASEARHFHYAVPMKVMQLYSGQSHRVETNKLNEGVDLLTSTIERLQWRRDGEKAFLS